MNLISVATLISAAGLLDAQVTLNPNPTRVLGHTTVRRVSGSPNLAEAKDLLNPSSVALDTSTSPPAMYVADTGNNRVLGWRSALSFNNGAPADIVVGQRDFITTLPAGPVNPGAQLSTGLAVPVAVAVDAQGNLYVADAGNNRILRYSKPFQQQDALKLPDMIIGQVNLNGSQPNSPSLSANSIFLSGSGRSFRSGLVFDSQGNLWFSDAGNNRVLRYSKATLDRNLNGPAADVQLGQNSFTTISQISSSDPRQKNVLVNPSALAFDNVGRLYVSDSFGGGRVLVYTRTVSGATADRIMGLIVLAQGQQAPPVVNDIGLGRSTSNGSIPPDGVFFANGTPYVVDTPSNRILRFDPYESWPNETQQFSPTARSVFGQQDFTSGKINRGLPEPSNGGFDTPLQAVVAGNEVYVVDSGNHRVLVFPTNNLSAATRVVGQSEFFQNAANNIDGREFYLFNGLASVGNAGTSDGGGLVIDKSSNPPRLYVSDTYNNRILGFKDARSVRPGDRADIVIGQRDFLRALVNNPANDVNQVTDLGLFLPSGLAVDAAGNLYVADSGNGRVLRYQRPFDQQAPIRPDLVLGQASFFIKVTDATSRTMNRPYGVALTNQGHLLVSDLAHNRVLFFRKPEGGDFTTGQAAEKVIGQPDFSSAFASNSPNRFTVPHGVSTDSDDRLYVADTGNNRVLIYDTITLSDIDPFPAVTLTGLGSPHGLYVNPLTAEFWVAAPSQNAVYRYPKFVDLLIGTQQPNLGITSSAPVGVTLDSFGNLLVAEGVTNRINLHFPALRAQNGGNKLGRLAPYTYTTLTPVTGATLAETTLNYKDLPDSSVMPTTLGDIQVLVNDVLAPIEYVAPDKIDIVLPKSTPIASDVPIVITRVSTGQIVGSSTLVTAREAPAFFTTSGDGRGQVMAKNPDGTANSASDRVGRSETISLFGTGFGIPPSGPDDGMPADGKVDGSGVLRIVIGTDFVPNENITYFGLAPGLVGVFQIDVKIPDRVAPEPAVAITCQYGSSACNTESGNRVAITIAVKP